VRAARVPRPPTAVAATAAEETLALPSLISGALGEGLPQTLFVSYVRHIGNATAFVRHPGPFEGPIGRLGPRSAQRDRERRYRYWRKVLPTGTVARPLP